MGRKSVPFELEVHRNGEKTHEEMMTLYEEFYIDQVKRSLNTLPAAERSVFLEHLISLFT